MLKKLMAVLLSLTMLAGLVTVPAFADATVVTDDFNSLTIAEADKGGWPSVSNLITICGGYTKTGVGGKLTTDASVLTNESTGSYILVKKAFSGVSVLEYNLLRTETGGTTRVEKDPYGGDLGLPNFRYSAGMYPSGKTYKAGQWYHLAYEMNLDDETVTDPAVGKYNYYVNGVKLSTGTIPAAITGGTATAYRLVNTSGLATYYDDFKFTTGAKYDASNAAATISAVTGGSVNESAKTVAISGVNVSDIASKLTLSTGATFAGVVDPATFMAKTEGAVEDGDYIAILGADGVTYTYYTVGIKKTEAFAQNFDNITVTEGSEAWFTIETNKEYIVNGTDVAGVGGKLSSDKSINMTSGGNSYYRKNGYTLYGRTTIEYNVLKKSTAYTYMGVAGGNHGWMYLRGNGDAPAVWTASNYQVGTYNFGQWTHMAFDMNFDDSSVSDPAVGKYNGYVNGVKVVSNGDIPSQFASGKALDIRFVGPDYIDDVKIYAGEYNPEGSVATLTSDAIAVDDDYKTLSIVKGTVADYIAKLTPSEGATITGVADSETFLTKAGTDAIEEGDLVAVLAPDGVSYNYYKVAGNVVNSYVDDDFTGLTGTRISDYKNGDGQAAAAGLTLTRTGLRLNTETGEGSFIEVVEEDNNEVLMLYTNNNSDEPFFGRNLTSGTANANAVEFSVMKPDKNSPTKLIFYGPKESTVNEGSNWSLINAYAATFETDGLIYFNRESVCKWNTNEWYRVVVVTDIPNNKMTLYLNGVKAAEKVLDDPIVKMFDIRFAGLKGTNESFTYFDDVKWYDYNGKAGFDDSEKIAALTAKSSNVTIKTGVAFGTIDTTLTTVGAILNEVEPTGTMKAYDASGVEIVDTTVAPAHGMYIEVTSIDGLAKAKYTYVVDSISDIFFDVEGNETTNGTISAKIHIVNSDEEITEVGKLFIAKYEGNKLVGVNFAKVDARCKVGGYVDNVFSASIDVVDSTKESIKAFYFGANGVKPLKGDKELSVSSTNF